MTGESFVQDLLKTQKFDQRHENSLLGLIPSQSYHNLSHCIQSTFFGGGFAATISVKLLLEVKFCFKTSRRFVKLQSVSVPGTRGLYSVHVIPLN